MIRGRHVWLTLGAVVVVVLLASLLIKAGDTSGGLQERAYDPTGTSGRVPTGVGGEGNNNVSGTVGREVLQIEALNGEAADLIGRNVSIEIQPGSAAAGLNAGAPFWVGPKNNPLLVVLARDTRNDLERRTGEPPAHLVQPIRANERVRITGRIEPVPNAEEAYSWNLSQLDARQLNRRPIYLRAFSVTPVDGIEQTGAAAPPAQTDSAAWITPPTDGRPDHRTPLTIDTGHAHDNNGPVASAAAERGVHNAAAGAESSAGAAPGGEPRTAGSGDTATQSPPNAPR